ncbi:hypothetical protein OROGR_019236 [Orobanche gracilis]
MDRKSYRYFGIPDFGIPKLSVRYRYEFWCTEIFGTVYGIEKKLGTVRYVTPSYELDDCESFLEHTRLNTQWSEGIGNTIFRAILNKKKGVANYTRSINIVHYMGASHGHMNESEFDQLRGANVIYNEDDVKKKLKSFFPKIILELFQSLYGYAVSINYKKPGFASNTLKCGRFYILLRQVLHLMEPKR